MATRPEIGEPDHSLLTSQANYVFKNKDLETRAIGVKTALTELMANLVALEQQSMMKRFFYSVGAVIALCIGALGLVIPIIPGVLFVVLAVVLFAGASRRFRNRLHASPRARPYLTRWEASTSLSLPERTKLAGLLLYAAATDSLRSWSPIKRT